MSGLMRWTKRSGCYYSDKEYVVAPATRAGDYAAYCPEGTLITHAAESVDIAKHHADVHYRFHGKQKEVSLAVVGLVAAGVWLLAVFFYFHVLGGAL